MIIVQCHNCGAKLKVKDALAGRRASCPKCRATVLIERQADRPDQQATSGENNRPRDESTELPPVGGVAASEPGRLWDDRDDSDAPIPFDSIEHDEPTPEIIVPESRSLGSADVLDEEPVEGSSISKTRHPSDSVADSENYAEQIPVRLDVHSHYLICDNEDVVARWQNDGQGWQVRVMEGFSRASTVAQHLPEVGKFTLIEIGVERTDQGYRLRNITPFKLREHYALVNLPRGDNAILRAVTGIGKLNRRQKDHVRAYIKSKFLPEMWPEVEKLMQTHGG